MNRTAVLKAAQRLICSLLDLANAQTYWAHSRIVRTLPSPPCARSCARNPNRCIVQALVRPGLAEHGGGGRYVHLDTLVPESGSGSVGCIAALSANQGLLVLDWTRTDWIVWSGPPPSLIGNHNRVSVT